MHRQDFGLLLLWGRNLGAFCSLMDASILDRRRFFFFITVPEHLSSVNVDFELLLFFLRL